MAQKKSFKSALNNPAMQFISVPEEEAPVVAAVEVEQATKQNTKPSNTVKQTAKKTDAKKANKPVQKKAEKPVQKTEATIAKAPEGYKINPMYVEVKSKRVQLVLQPSLFEKVKALAAKNGDSVNNTIHAILEGATQQD